MITQQKIKELLHYDPDTGVFTRLLKSGNKVTGCPSKDGYIQISINYKNYRAHRLAWFYMTGEWPKNQIDHDDHIRHNNRWNNLFEATNQQNGKNQSKKSNNTSGVTGVCWHKDRSKWCASIRVNEKSKNLGRFVDKFEAICARKSADNKYGYHENHGV